MTPTGAGVQQSSDAASPGPSFGRPLGGALGRTVRALERIAGLAGAGGRARGIRVASSLTDEPD